MYGFLNLGITRKKSESKIGENSTTATSGVDSWHTVGAVQPNKFQMKKSPRKKYIDVGTTVICIHTKVRARDTPFLGQIFS